MVRRTQQKGVASNREEQRGDETKRSRGGAPPPHKENKSRERGRNRDRGGEKPSSNKTKSSSLPWRPWRAAAGLTSMKPKSTTTKVESKKKSKKKEAKSRSPLLLRGELPTDGGCFSAVAGYSPPLASLQQQYPPPPREQHAVARHGSTRAAHGGRERKGRHGEARHGSTRAAACVGGGEGRGGTRRFAMDPPSSVPERERRGSEAEEPRVGERGRARSRDFSRGVGIEKKRRGVKNK